jgi:outer membrane receptor protein involved in Fe transport
MSRLAAQTPAKDSAFLNHVSVIKEVEVVGKGPGLRSGLDKKVFAVNTSLVSVGGSATDLLANIPTLQIDGNGNISLRGATNVKVLVDGKRSLIGGGSIAEILASIPAASIEKIEVITNPSAKYDAEGQGVINIILKKGGRQGVNGAVTASAGTRANYNAGGSLSYGSGKVDLYGNYSFQRKNTYSNGYQNMTYLNSGDATYYSDERFPSTTITDVHAVQAGVDWRVSGQDVISIAGQFNGSTRDRHEYLTVNNLAVDHTPVQLSTRANTTKGWNNSYGASVDYTHTFAMPSEELDVDFAWSAGSGNSFQVYNTDIYNVDGQVVKPVPDILQDDKGGHNNNYNIQLDYSLPVGKGGRLEAGGRSQFLLSDNRQWDAEFDTLTGRYEPDYSLINYFKTNNQVHALYINYRQPLKSYTIQAGLRGEVGRFDASLRSYDSLGGLVTEPIRVNTSGIYPSLFVTRQLSATQQVQLSYTRRINRPTPGEIDPFPDVSDPVNYDEGNTGLRPESIHSVELTYKKNWPGITLTSGYYYTQVDNVIKHVQTNPVEDVTYTIAENLKRAINTGLEFIGHVRVVDFWSFTANVNVYDRINSAAPQFGIAATSGVSWNGNITNDFSVVKGLSAQLRADYKASEFILQDRYRPNYGFDAGAKYDFARGKATLSFSGRDILNTRRWTFLRVSDELLLDFQRVTYSARASLAFTYRFGRVGEPKRRKEAQEQEGKRVENR